MARILCRPKFLRRLRVLFAATRPDVSLGDTDQALGERLSRKFLAAKRTPADLLEQAVRL
jgi:hypothetical protein